MLARHLWRTLAIESAAQPGEGRARPLRQALRLPALHRRHMVLRLAAILNRIEAQNNIGIYSLVTKSKGLEGLLCLPFQRSAIPLCRIGCGLIGALEKFEQHFVRRS